MKDKVIEEEEVGEEDGDYKKGNRGEENEGDRHGGLSQRRCGSCWPN